MSDDVELEGPGPLGVVLPISAVLCGLAGMFTLAAGAQLLAVLTIWTWAWVVPWMLFALGLVGLPLSGFVFSGRTWAVALSIPVNALAGMIGLGWTVYAATNGFFSLLPFVAPLVSLAAAALLPVAIVPARRLSVQRAKLYAD